MSTTKNFGKGIGRVFTKPILIIADIVAVFGLIISIFGDTKATIFGLVFFCINIFILNVYLLYTLFKVNDGNKGEYIGLATHINYDRNKAGIISYEVIKYIQCNVPIMDSYIYSYKWTGSNYPKIVSEIQELKHIEKTDKDEYDKCILKFKTPLYLKQIMPIHIKMEINDSDGAGKKFVEGKISEPITLMNFNVTLRAGNKNMRAKISRRKINLPHGNDYECIETIPFDIDTKNFTYKIVNPDVGYFYRLDWS